MTKKIQTPSAKPVAICDRFAVTLMTEYTTDELLRRL